MTVMQDEMIQLSEPRLLTAWMTQASALSEDATASPWRARVRGAGVSAFARLGLPTRRDEEWRQLNIRAVESGLFVAAPGGTLDAADVAHLQFPDLDAVELIFVNGVYCESLSNCGEISQDVTITPFSRASEDEQKVIASHIDTIAPTDCEPFPAMNAALFDDGVLVHVPKGVVVDRPIRVLHVNAVSEQKSMTIPRVLLIADESSEVTVIEDYAGLADADRYLTNGVCEIFVGANAHVRHYYIERDAPNALCFSSRSVQIDRDARFKSHSVMFGGSLVRNDILPRIIGPGADCVLNGVYIGDEEQQIDTHVHITHGQPNCTSNQYFRGVLAGSSRGSFTGRILVEQAAQKTDAVQSSQHLVLSDDARAHSKPQLEIFADDVRCTHGATIGQLDADALFYLRSRGMDEHVARSLLVYAFASEGIALMDLDPVEGVVKDMLAARLPDAASLRDIF